MKKLFQYGTFLACVMSCFACRESHTPEEKAASPTTAKKEARAQPKPVQSSFDCKKIHVWLEENARVVNPDTLPLPYTVVYDTLRPLITPVCDCLEAKKLPYGEWLSRGRFYGLYKNAKKEIVGISVATPPVEMGTGLYYLSLDAQGRVIAGVLINHNFGDMGFVSETKSKRLDANTIQCVRKDAFRGELREHIVTDIRISENGRIDTLQKRTVYKNPNPIKIP